MTNRFYRFFKQKIHLRKPKNEQIEFVRKTALKQFNSLLLRNKLTVKSLESLIFMAAGSFSELRNRLEYDKSKINQKLDSKYLNKYEAILGDYSKIKNNSSEIDRLGGDSSAIKESLKTLDTKIKSLRLTDEKVGDIRDGE